MNDFQLKCFLAVAETLNFARAAVKLNVTQPTVTHQIQTLESELGTQLFSRTTRSVNLSKAGEIFISDAKKIVTTSETAKVRLKYQFGEEVPKLSLACHSSLELLYMSDVLQALAFKYYGFHPEITTLNNRHIYQMLEEGLVDLVLAFEELKKRRIPGHYLEIAKVPIVAVVRFDSVFAERDYITFDDIIKTPLILWNFENAPLQFAELLKSVYDEHRAANVHFGETPETCTILTRTGFGLTLLPENIVPIDPEIKTIPLIGVEPISFGLYYNKSDDNEILNDFLQMAEMLGK